VGGEIFREKIVLRGVDSIALQSDVVEVFKVMSLRCHGGEGDADCSPLLIYCK